MDAESNARIRELFGDALNQPEDERRKWLASMCLPGEQDIQLEVEQLLEAHANAGSFIRQPPAEVARAMAAFESGEDEAANWIGRLLKGRYRIVKRLGAGGFGTVFLAEDEQLSSRQVVVKTSTNVEASAEWLDKRFAAEREALARIDDPGVVGVFDSGETPEGSRFLVMQYVPGLTLRELMARERLAPERVCRLGAQMAGALAVAHAAGVRHRDLKPENIVIREPGTDRERAVLIDFGISRLGYGDASQVTTQIVGSPMYMAPEQLLGRATEASDLYSLGLVLFEMFTGQHLHACEEVGAPDRVAAAQLLRAVPSLPTQARKKLASALSLEPDGRPASALELEAALGNVDSHRAGFSGWLPTAGAGIVVLLAVITLMLTLGPQAGRSRSSFTYSFVTQAAPSSPFANTSARGLLVGEKFRLRIQAPRGGYFYAVNESLLEASGRSSWGVLTPGGSRTSAWVEPHSVVEIPASQDAWLEFDGAAPAEFIWMIWSAQKVSELEPLLTYSKPPYYGEIDSKAVVRIAGFLHGAETTAPSFDDQEHSGLVESEGGLLIAKVALQER